MNTHAQAIPYAINRSQAKSPIRFITATSLFDGHDAAINIIRRLLQSHGVEVIHLGHNRSVEELVTAAVQEDVDAIAVSCYQGGHMEFYRFLLDQLACVGMAHVHIFAGGGGVIRPPEIKALRQAGIAAVYSAEDGQNMGLNGMIDDMLRICRSETGIKQAPTSVWQDLPSRLSRIEQGATKEDRFLTKADAHIPVVGISGVGGCGKSSLIDELIWRFRQEYGNQLNIGLLAVDPSRVKTGGALLGDRLRMNALNAPNVFMRSMATRDTTNEIPKALPGFLGALQKQDFDLILVETPGIGQGDSGIAAYADIVLYVMTSEFGAPTQLEKINMLDFCDLVAINKFDRKNSCDALQLVQKQIQRNRAAFDTTCNEMPVFGTRATRNDDLGTSRLYRCLREMLNQKGFPKPIRPLKFGAEDIDESVSESQIPPDRQHYLESIADVICDYHQQCNKQSELAHRIQSLYTAEDQLSESLASSLDHKIQTLSEQCDPGCADILQAYLQKNRSTANDRKIDKYTSLSGLDIEKISGPAYTDHGDLLSWLMLENLPGNFPFTAGVFANKRQDEEATRMFAGEGEPGRTNKRFKFLCKNSQAQRLSVAFDSVTLYGCDPDEKPDVFGKIGNAGVSVATLDDMKTLFQGFDLCHPKTSVSMTINGPAPILLAMFFNTAIDQQLKKFSDLNHRPPEPEEAEKIRRYTLRTVRGTVQADILKEDQGQNTCIFSTDFSLNLLADVQEYFIEQEIRYFYSLSISGYHIAEAGANPITQLAFTLANAFSYVELFRGRGMRVDDFASRLSFFFSNGMDPEYAVIGRVARRIWAIAMRDYYGAGEISQKLKYHIQTSGRSLHAQTLDFNEIRTTLQALNAIYDQCNSLHTNARDEAVTTPTENSLRSALAIQAIINKEWGLAQFENPWQGSFLIEKLTDYVEQAVLEEFRRISHRGGVLDAMESGYQRSKIQEQSLKYEAAKQDGSLPIIGINTENTPLDRTAKTIDLSRSSDDEKYRQIKRLRAFHERHRSQSFDALDKLKQSVRLRRNIFSQLMHTVQHCSLGQITNAFYEIGGQYRRIL